MNALNNVTDKQLIESYLEGNNQAFSELLNRHRDRIYTSIYLFVKNKDIAEDLFQEVFMKIIRTIRKGKYKHEGKFIQWALRISYNICVDDFRKRKRKNKIQRTDTFDIFDVIESQDATMENKIIRSQQHIQVRQLVDSLPIEQREVVILRHYADMSFKEIADVTRVSINTALGRMRYALINMKKMAEANSTSLL